LNYAKDGLAKSIGMGGGGDGALGHNLCVSRGMFVTKRNGTDHDVLIKLVTEFGGHTNECKDRYAEQRKAADNLRSIMDTGMSEIKGMIQGISSAAATTADTVAASSAQLNSRINALSTRVLLAVISGAGVVIVGLLMVLGTLLMYGRPWDHM
jgi:hypothetical protein